MKKYIGRHNLFLIDMEEQLLEIFRSVFTSENPEEITLDSEFREFEQFSSMIQMVLIEKIMNEMNVQLKLRPFIKAETIGDVLDIISEAS